MIIIYTTCPSLVSAERIGTELLKRRLAGCYTVWPVRSKHWWKGKIVSARETALFIKSMSRSVTKAKKVIEETHPYAAPLLLVITARQLNHMYGAWLNKECR